MASAVEQILVEYLGDVSDLKGKSKQAEDAIDGVGSKAGKTGGKITQSLKNIELGAVLQIVTEVAEVSFKVGTAIGEWWQEERREAFMRDLEEMKRLNEDIQQNQGRQQQEAFKELKLIEDPEEAFDFLDEELAKANRDLGGLKVQFNRVKQNAEDMEPTWKSLWQAGKEGSKIADEQLADVNKRLEAQREHIEDLSIARGELLEKQKQEAKQLEEKNIKAAQELGEKYHFLSETFGMTSREVEIYRLRMKGVAEEELEFAKRMDRQLKHLEEQKKLREEAARAAEREAKEKERMAERAAKAAQREQEAFDRKVTNMKNRLKEQIIEMKQGEQAALAFRLAQEGITGQDAQEILNLNKKLMMLEKEKELREELKEKIKAYFRALEESNKLNDALSGDRNFDISAAGLTSDIGTLKDEAAAETAGTRGQRGGGNQGNGMLSRINVGIRELIRVTAAKQAVEVQEVDSAEV